MLFLKLSSNAWICHQGRVSSISRIGVLGIWKLPAAHFLDPSLPNFLPLLYRLLRELKVQRLSLLSQFGWEMLWTTGICWERKAWTNCCHLSRLLHHIKHHVHTHHLAMLSEEGRNLAILSQNLCSYGRMIQKSTIFPSWIFHRSLQPMRKFVFHFLLRYHIALWKVGELKMNLGREDAQPLVQGGTAPSVHWCFCLICLLWHHCLHYHHIWFLIYQTMRSFGAIINWLS